jgi:hypothetical protein
MDAKLKDALSTKDYYSAHQIYLAIAQRHCRNKRFEEAKQTLKDGCLELSGCGESKSAVDLARRYIDTLSLGRLPLIDIDAIGVHAVLTSIGRKAVEEDSVKAVSEMVIKEHPTLLLVVFHALLQVGAHKEAAMALLKLDEAGEEWRLLGGAVSDPHVVLCITLAGLKARNFGAISTFLSTVLATRFPDAAGASEQSPNEDLADFITVLNSGELQGEGEVLARTLNLCQVFFALFQHRLTPTPSSLNKTLQHYAGLLAKLRVREEDVRAIEHSYLMQQHSESAPGGAGGRSDLLANLFQSMMSQSGGAAAIKRK